MLSYSRDREFAGAMPTPAARPGTILAVESRAKRRSLLEVPTPICRGTLVWTPTYRWWGVRLCEEQRWVRRRKRAAGFH
jgi:hypothetical protein